MIPKDKIFSSEPEPQSDSNDSQGTNIESFSSINEYRLPCDSVEMIIQNIGILSIVGITDKKMQKSLHADLKIGDGTIITIDSDLKNQNEVKTMFSSIKSSVIGNGYLTIRSEIDLQKELKDLDVNFNQI